MGNLSILGFFKYFNFFIENFQNILHYFGYSHHQHSLNIILPLGISFYTLQSLSYSIDIYRKGMRPTKNFLDFALFVAFFPQLVAGPIERARTLLPQVVSKRKLTLEKFYEGSFLIFWGLFLKVFIADNLAKIVDPVYGNPAPYNGMIVLLSTYAFCFQIFCDFAGYSSMARGLGKVMGFDIMLNFNLPYFVPNIQEFWNKWHISLSTWVRDYMYVPLFFKLRDIQEFWRIPAVLMLTMAVMGLWHGAHWVFILWGIYHGLLLVAYMMLRKYWKHQPRPKNPWGQHIWLWARMIFTFHLIATGMMIFRAQGIDQVFAMLEAIFFNFTFDPQESILEITLKLLFFTSGLIVIQLIQFYKKDLLCVYRSRMPVRATFYAACYLLLLFFGVDHGKEFIYFQF